MSGIALSSTQISSFLMMGQSNMAGRGKISNIAPIDNPLCLMLRNGRWQPMCEPVNMDRPFGVSGISLAASFADCYAKQYGQRVGLIPCAEGATRLEEWMPGELLFDHAVYQAKLAMRTSDIKAVLWHQGESDCASMDDVEQYAERFLRMVEELRFQLHMPGLSVVIGELSEEISPEWNTEKRQLELNSIFHRIVDEMPHCAVASAYGLRLKADGIHFNAASCREFGRRYFDALYGMK